MKIPKNIYHIILLKVSILFYAHTIAAASLSSSFSPLCSSTQDVISFVDSEGGALTVGTVVFLEGLHGTSNVIKSIKLLGLAAVLQTEASKKKKIDIKFSLSGGFGFSYSIEEGIYYGVHLIEFVDPERKLNVESRFLEFNLSPEMRAASALFPDLQVTAIKRLYILELDKGFNDLEEDLSVNRQRFFALLSDESQVKFSD